MPLSDGIKRKQVELLALQTLLEAETMAADRVFEPKPWPTTTANFPMIIVSAPRDRKVSVTRGQLQFMTVISLVVVGRVVGSSAEQAQDTLEDLADEIEEAIFCTPSFTGHFSQFSTVDTSSVVNSDGRNWIGECALTLECELLQTWVPKGTPLIGVEATITNGPRGARMAQTKVEFQKPARPAS